MIDINEKLGYWVEDGKYYDLETELELDTTEVEFRQFLGERPITYAAIFEEIYGRTPTKEELKKFIENPKLAQD